MSLHVLPVWGIPLVEPGEDLAKLIVDAMVQSGVDLQDNDVVVVAQKLVSKTENRQLKLSEIQPSKLALELASEVEKDPRIVELILRESTDIVRKKPGVLITRHKLGHVCANAGIDQSNISHQEGESALLLPQDPDASARRLQSYLNESTLCNIGVIISDSTNRPWRLGSIGIAIGVANVEVIDDRRGETDLFGRKLEVTVLNQADAIASAATLVMGETIERVPVAVVRGLSTFTDSASAKDSHRPLAEDLFR